jgi:protein SCO1/2
MAQESGVDVSLRNSKHTGWMRIAVAVAVTAASFGCGGGETAPDEDPNARRYELKGEVVSVSRERQTITLDHEPVADFMGAMTMPFNVRDDWVFEAAAPGAQVTATLVVAGSASWLEDVIVRTPAAEGTAAEAVIPAPDRGAEVPAIDLLDQSGATLNLSAYRGDYFAYTFIYTRCPLPDFCPRMSENFDVIYRAVQAAPAQYGGLKLLSLSIDPEFDTPEVLSDYARRYLPDATPEQLANWRFATSTPTSLHDLGEFSGIRYRPDRAEFVHSLRTILVDPEGRVVQAFIGNSWEPEELLAAMETALLERAE